jgi:chromosome segregation ATPase
MVLSTIREFNETFNMLRDMRIKLEKLNQLISSGEVSSQTAESIRKDYMSQLIGLLDKFFKLRAELEDLRVRCIVEMERAKVDAGATGSSDIVSRLEELTMRIDDALESLDMDSRLFIASQYAQYLKSPSVNQNALREKKLMYRRFVDSIIESWLVDKADLESELSDLERDANNIREQLKELWVRFMVGEYDRSEYDAKRSRLEEDLSSINARITELRSKLDTIDERIIELTSVIGAEEVEETG